MIPFGASVMPAVWSSSSLAFKLFPKDASLPGGGGDKEGQGGEDIINTRQVPKRVRAKDQQ